MWTDDVRLILLELHDISLKVEVWKCTIMSCFQAAPKIEITVLLPFIYLCVQYVISINIAFSTRLWLILVHWYFSSIYWTRVQAQYGRDSVIPVVASPCFATVSLYGCRPPGVSESYVRSSCISVSSTENTMNPLLGVLLPASLSIATRVINASLIVASKSETGTVVELKTPIAMTFICLFSRWAVAAVRSGMCDGRAVEPFLSSCPLLHPYSFWVGSGGIITESCFILQMLLHEFWCVFIKNNNVLIHLILLSFFSFSMFWYNVVFMLRLTDTMR